MDQNNLPQNKRYLGYVYQVLFIVTLSLQHFFGKLLFIRHTSMTSLQMLVLRSVFAGLVFIAIMNKQFAHYMWKSVPRAQVGDLISRVIQGLVLMVCIFNSIKYFPLVFVSLVSNLTPLLTALLSYFIYNVGLSRLDTTILIVSFVGVTVLITGGHKGSNKQTLETDSFLIPSLMLILIPLLSASVTLFIRHLRSISEITVGSIMTFSILLLYGPVIYFTDFPNTKSLIAAFTSIDWLYALMLGLMSSIVQIAKVKALQYEEPAKLSVLMYFQSVIQLVLDVVFLGTMFSGQEAWGVAIVFGANLKVNFIYMKKRLFLNGVKWGIELRRAFRGRRERID